MRVLNGTLTRQVLHFFGSLWEAAVHSTKKYLKRIIGEQKLTFTQFYTLPCRIEAVFHSRPLITFSDESSDLQPLTPTHFLIGQASCPIKNLVPGTRS